jgi:dihydropteroate synthase
VIKEYIFQVSSKNFTLGLRTWIMGVVNVTPDSFSDGGRYFDKDEAIKKGLHLVEEGSDIIDIGGESTKPALNPSLQKKKSSVLFQSSPP